MLHKRPIAEYPFTQVHLWQRGLDLQPALARDAVRLAKYGVDADRIKKFNKKVADFGEMDPDTVLVQEGAVVTGDKNVEQAALVTSIQQVMGCVGLLDDPRTAGYKRFGATDVANDSEAELHLAAGVVVRQGRKYLDRYKGKGLTAEMLTAVEDNNEKFVAGLTTRKEAESERHAATDKRIVFANELYAELVDICGAGHESWKFEDETMAKEYVVDATSPAAPVVPPMA